MDQFLALEQRLAQLEARVIDLETCNRGNVTAVMRVKAHASAAYSLLAEVTERHGLPAEVIETHFQVRSAYYLDRMLADAEEQDPVLGAVLDDREEAEVPEFDGYPPLFAGDEDDDEASDSGEPEL